MFYSFLATGDSYTGLEARFRMSRPSVHDAINDTCDAIWDVLSPKYMPKPKRADWERIEQGFRNRWQFPNCIGAVDGKHISVIKPADTGSLFFNYKGYFSTVLMAVVDASYRFITVDIGEYGANTDSNVFRNSKFGKKFMENKLDLPPNKRLPNMPNEGPMPHVLIGDEAFPCLHNLMRPYPRHDKEKLTIPRNKAVFNYRLCRARMTVECTFGILAQRFRIFNRRIPLSIDNADKIIKAACVLHNFLTEDKEVDRMYAEADPTREYLDDDGVAVLYLPRLNGYRTSDEAKGVREIFTSYFNSPQGRVSWQDDRITYRRS